MCYEVIHLLTFEHNYCRDVSSTRVVGVAGATALKLIKNTLMSCQNL